ncbi:prion-like-(Q/N-rich) domain-bearing protein 25 [Cotesia glomerata]|uniref:prion-like-(Q/N-rich) domain-bearing protein 25 n=1 Tax=Cotesia glomerata TaxID=32391 RepID=UPI001D01E329|nr:prion-like-(Q/N-rich) domain-bearing protein 25 [Cotesia glomerata]
MCTRNSNLGESCSNSDQCTTRFSFCDGRSCQCQLHYHSVNGACVGFDNALCYVNSDCYKGKGTVPNPSRECLHNECRCLPNYRPHGHSCLPLTNGSCYTHKDCYVEDSICVGTCQCSSEHYEKNFKCHSFATRLRDDCYYHEDCQNVIILTCGHGVGCPDHSLYSQCVDYECSCPDGYSRLYAGQYYCSRPGNTDDNSLTYSF